MDKIRVDLDELRVKLGEVRVTLGVKQGKLPLSMKWCSSGLFVIILFKEDFKLFASNWIKCWPFDWSRVENVGFTRIESTAPVRFKFSWL